MPVSHGRTTAVTSTDEQASGKVPGLLEVLARVPDPRRFRGRRYRLAFVLAVAVACVLAGAKTFREIGDQAADLPQEVLRRLGGTRHPLRGKIITPSEKRIRTLIHVIGADVLDELIGGWLRALADALARRVREAKADTPANPDRFRGGQWDFRSHEGSRQPFNSFDLAAANSFSVSAPIAFRSESSWRRLTRP